MNSNVSTCSIFITTGAHQKLSNTGNLSGIPFFIYELINNSSLTKLEKNVREKKRGNNRRTHTLQ